MRRPLLPVCAGIFVAAFVSVAAAQFIPDPASPDSSLPGQTIGGLAHLPDLLGAQWIPQVRGSGEIALLGSLSLPPVKPEFSQTMTAALAGLRAGSEKSMAADCRLEGMPRLAWYPYPLQFLYGPGAVMIRANGFVRGVETNGLKHPDTLFDGEVLQAFSIMGDQRAI